MNKAPKIRILEPDVPPVPGASTGELPLKGKKPDWLRVRAPMSPEYQGLKQRVRDQGLHTVCEEAACPNIGDCWASGHLTVMVLGDVCTRSCAFCNIKTGRPGPVDADEPARLAAMVAELQLKHVVITSVDRDDLPDAGAGHWVACIEAIRAAAPATTIEILTPDFRRREEYIDKVANAQADVFNHNLETVPRLYREIRPSARYYGSLRLLERVKERQPNSFTKSGIMVGLGETYTEVLQVMDDMRAAGVDFITIGQYLRPSERHAPVREFVSPEQFKEYERLAKIKGFLMVSSTPLTRSSYHADKFFADLKQQRLSGSL